MSYSIFYDKQFFKLDNGFYIPMILAGDNNVYTGHGRHTKRARDWQGSGWLAPENYMATAEHLMQTVAKEREQHAAKEDYSDKNYGYFSCLAVGASHWSKTTFGRLQGFVKSGIQQAKTIEEMAALGVNIEVYLYPSYDNGDEKLKALGLVRREPVILTSSAQAVKVLNDWATYYKPFGGWYLRLNSHNSMDRIRSNEKLNRRMERKTKPDTIVEVKEYWVLECKDGYFVKNNPKSYQYHYDHTSYRVKKFLDETAVNTYHKKMKRKELFTPVKKELFQPMKIKV